VKISPRAILEDPMGATDADRQRRRRARLKAHEQGDHSQCLSGPCVEPAGDERDVTGTDDGLRLGPAGHRLWDELAGDRETAGRRVLVLQACRITDRLEALDQLLRGDAEQWLDIVATKGDPDRQELVIDKALTEERQQATALKQLLAELRQGATTTGGQEQGGSILDQLAAQRAKRLANASGS
ncbi:MAG TPA: hypothetical protein VFR67_05880, partial [Pilimelia sp.]|nr:hypothetical protein [Pilimelia sp.]